MPGREEVRIGISACLLGQPVRYDGGHKRDAFVMETLARYVTFVAVCPEVEIGLGTPRETLRLVRAPRGMRLLEPRTGRDHTRAIRAYAAARVRALADLDLSGYLLKSKSPSCGMDRVRAFDAGGRPARAGRGLFAEALLAGSPLLPVEEESGIADLARREHFLERVYAYRRLRRLFAPRWRLDDLIAFHEAARLQVLAHDPAAHPSLGRIIARARALGRAAVVRRYGDRYLRALALPVTTRRHAGILREAADSLRRVIRGDEHQALARAIDLFREGRAPRSTPLALLRDHVRAHKVSHFEAEHYLEPFPLGLMEAIAR